MYRIKRSEEVNTIKDDSYKRLLLNDYSDLQGREYSPESDTHIESRRGNTVYTKVDRYSSRELVAEPYVDNRELWGIPWDWIIREEEELEF